jgi:3'-5' exoribonuclease
MRLRDRSGTVAARAFRDADRIGLRFDAGDAITVRGKVERFRGELVIEVDDANRIEPGSFDATEFLPTAYRSAEELEGFLEHLAREVHDPALRKVVDAVAFTGPLADDFRRAPCTRRSHHAYLGGLLEHTVAVATLVLETCALHPRLDSDLLMAAAIVHDAGRAREFTYGAEFGLSDEGRLLGHLVIGAEIVGAAATSLAPERRLALLNCVLSHHGPDSGPGRAQQARGKAGAAQGFASAEALALYRLNALDASVKGALEHGPLA